MSAREVCVKEKVLRQGESFAEACARAHLEVVEESTLQALGEFRSRWRRTFAPPETNGRRTSFEWDLLPPEGGSTRSGRAALRAFDARRLEVASAFIAVVDGARGFFEVAGTLPASSWWTDAFRAHDVLLVAPNWDWSFVLTHEEGIGPFFVESALTDPSME